MQSKKQQVKNKIKFFNLLIKVGLLLVALSLLLLVITVFPVIYKEIDYIVSKPDADLEVLPNYVTSNEEVSEENAIVAANPDFSIVIPKIGANSGVIAKVNPYDSKIYQQALTRGVAHAEGTVFPGQVGNSFFFAHSSDTFYNANRYNSVFYLLNKMEINDLFYVVYDFELFKYKVTDVRVVAPEAVEYLESSHNGKSTATLMTCWPAGTTLNRLVVVGELLD